MFSQTAEYALRAIAYLGDQFPNARTTGQIAEATLVPSAYLSKVMQSLNRAGIIRSQRGIGGGMMLAIEPKDLTILDVINAVDPIRRIQECPLGLAAHGVKLCPLHTRLDDAMALVEEAFRDTTLADMLDSSSARRKQCRFPKAGAGA